MCADPAYSFSCCAAVAITHLPEEVEDANATKAMVEKGGRKCLLLCGNLEDKAYCSKIVEDTVQTYGKISILVNKSGRETKRAFERPCDCTGSNCWSLRCVALSAAYQGKKTKSFDDFDYERVLRTFKVNIVSFFETSRAAVRHMKPGSSIINTGSIQAYDPSNYILDYACTKGAIVSFSKVSLERAIVMFTSICLFHFGTDSSCF